MTKSHLPLTNNGIFHKILTINFAINMKYEVFYNVLGVMPVHHHYSTMEEAEKMLKKAKDKGFDDAKIIEH